MASTGSSRDADHEGINPETNPISAETVNPNTMFLTDRVMAKSKKPLIIQVNISTSSKPTIPPKSDKKTASNKNCNKIK
jgi:hypothetical protein